jgi:3'(2'), 5'-bisphosphate nucleotidase
LKDRIIELANEALTAELGLGDSTTWGIGPGQEKSAEELLDAIDRGNHPGGREGREFLERSFFSSVLFSFSGE